MFDIDYFCSFLSLLETYIGLDELVSDIRCNCQPVAFISQIRAENRFVRKPNECFMIDHIIKHLIVPKKSPKYVHDFKKKMF